MTASRVGQCTNHHYCTILPLNAFDISCRQFYIPLVNIKHINGFVGGRVSVFVQQALQTIEFHRIGGNLCRKYKRWYFSRDFQQGKPKAIESTASTRCNAIS